MKKNSRKIYQGNDDICAACHYKPRCCQSKKGTARSLTGDENEAIRQRMKQTMETDKAKEIYAQRKVIVEPVFGQIKNTGFREFSLRGLKKVSGEFSLVCATHNLKKIVSQVIAGVVRPENGKWINVG